MPTCCMIRRTKELLVVAGTYARIEGQEVRPVAPGRLSATKHLVKHFRCGPNLVPVSAATAIAH